MAFSHLRCCLKTFKMMHKRNEASTLVRSIVILNSSKLDLSIITSYTHLILCMSSALLHCFQEQQDQEPLSCVALQISRIHHWLSEMAQPET